jgi:hypothetical protein
MTDLDLRASDDDRQAVIDRLSAHFRAGRIDAEELEERTAVATAAKTYGELAALEADLPEPQAPAPSRARHAGERVLGALSFSAILWIIWLATGADGFAWPLIPTAVALLGALGDSARGPEPAALPEPPRPPEPPRRP